MIALTGPNGFVGSAVAELARIGGQPLVPLTRHTQSTQTEACAPRCIGDLGVDPIDPCILAGCTAVIHTAARAHRMNEHGVTALAAYRQTNVIGTAKLIEAMTLAGVRRLVYVSSIKALGERSREHPLRPQDERHPEDPYGVSKAEAEDLILTAHAQGLIEGVIIRPVLVHGTNAKGNLNRLMHAVLRRKILPLGSVTNRRSLVGTRNLAAALLTAATVPLPKPQLQPAFLYHIADDGVISTRRLVEVLAEGMGVAPRLVSVPRWLAVGGATMLGKAAIARRLFDDMEVDDRDFRHAFNWTPHLGLEQGLRLMAADFAQRTHPDSTGS